MSAINDPTGKIHDCLRRASEARIAGNLSGAKLYLEDAALAAYGDPVARAEVKRRQAILATLIAPAVAMTLRSTREEVWVHRGECAFKMQGQVVQQPSLNVIGLEAAAVMRCGVCAAPLSHAPD